MGFRFVRVHREHHDKFAGMLCEIVLLAMAKGVWLKKRQNYSAGSTASTPFFFTMTTTNFAGFVVLALRPTVCTSLGPS
jgi:hypothetical protein